MKIQLIKGAFSKNDTEKLLVDLIDIKIKFHENKILATDNEEDIKMREKRIKELQKNLSEVKSLIHSMNKECEIESEILIQFI